MQCVILKGQKDYLTPVLGRPWIHLLLEWIAVHSFSKALLAHPGDLGKGDWKIHLDQQKVLGDPLQVLRDADQQGILEPSFTVVYGDRFLPVDFAEIFLFFPRYEEPVLMGLCGKGQSGLPCQWDEKKVTNYGKGDRVEAGLFAMSRRAIRESQASDWSTFLKDQVEAGRVAGYPLETPIQSIDSISRFLKP